MLIRSDGGSRCLRPLPRLLRCPWRQARSPPSALVLLRLRRRANSGQWRFRVFQALTPILQTRTPSVPSPPSRMNPETTVLRTGITTSNNRYIQNGELRREEQMQKHVVRKLLKSAQHQQRLALTSANGMSIPIATMQRGGKSAKREQSSRQQLHWDGRA